MSEVDCLIVGFYDYPFPEYVSMLQAMGTDSGAYQDVALAFIEIDGRPLRALDVLTHYYNEGQSAPRRVFHNADFLWPVVVYLTTYLSRRGLKVDYVNLPHLEEEKLHEKLQNDVRTVALTTTLYVSPHSILALVKQVRKYNDEVKIIVGGPYISGQALMLGRDRLTLLLEYLGCDVYVLCQEGEATLAATLKALRSGESLATVPNLAFKDADGSFVITSSAPELNDLNENIIDYSSFLDHPLSEFLSVRTSKSCPYSCAFCGFPQRAGKYQFLDVPSVEMLLDKVAETGTVTTLTFLDDTFNVPKSRFKEILRMMIRNDYGFHWNCFYRSDQGDEETIDLMARAGCEGVFLGIESGSDEMLGRMRKTARSKHYRQAIPRFSSAGISTYTSLIIGFPGETDDSVLETMSFLEETAPEFFRAQLWYADPMTPIWLQGEQYGIQGMGFNWRHHTMSARDACGWIERMFLEIKGSIWLPQIGFEQWSTFYLSRMGMSRQQIRTFLESFNAVIKHRLVSGEAQAPATLLDALRSCCQIPPGNSRGRLTGSARPSFAKGPFVGS